MEPANLQHGKQYKHTVTDKPDQILIYRYETLNHWLFDKVNKTGFILLQKYEVINNIIEINNEKDTI